MENEMTTTVFEVSNVPTEVEVKAGATVGKKALKTLVATVAVGGVVMMVTKIVKKRKAKKAEKLATVECNDYVDCEAESDSEEESE